MDNEMAEKIRRLRREKGLTLEQVASVVGVGKSTVRKWETGMIENMKRDKIASLAKALGTTPAYLMGWEENSEDKPSPISDSELKFALFNAQDGITDEMLEEVRQFAEFVKNKK